MNGEKGTGNEYNSLTRRRFCKGALLGLGGLTLGEYLTGRPAFAEGAGPLPAPIITGNSVEICMNSRVCRHSGLTGTATDQQIANVLWAAGRAPVVGNNRTIYLRTRNGSYIYHPEEHALEYFSGTTVSNAFRLNYDRELDFDAGVSYVLALWASVSLWTGTASQVAHCPQMSDLNFGVASVTGLTSQLVALSSDGTLPNPTTISTNHFEEVVADLRLRSEFRADLDLTPQRLSQILWGGYGCTPHMTANNRAGLTIPSWVADYFLTNRIYVIDSRVNRFSNRTGSNLATRNHRLELVQGADVRDALRQALPDLPVAPCYIVLCLTQTGLDTWYHRLEVGMAAGGMLLESAALGLACDFKAALSSAEQTAVKQIAQLPSGDYPHAIVALGHRPADLNGDGLIDGDDLDSLDDCMSGPDIDAGPDCLPADRNHDADVDLDDFSNLQRD